jgi:hypothetical protein
VTSDPVHFRTYLPRWEGPTRDRVLCERLTTSLTRPDYALLVQFAAGRPISAVAREIIVAAVRKPA